MSTTLFTVVISVAVGIGFLMSTTSLAYNDQRCIALGVPELDMCWSISEIMQSTTCADRTPSMQRKLSRYDRIPLDPGMHVRSTALWCTEIVGSKQDSARCRGLGKTYET